MKYSMKRQIFMLTFIVIAIAAAYVAPTLLLAKPDLTTSNQCDVETYEPYRFTEFDNSGIISEWVICPVGGILNTMHSNDGLVVDVQYVSTASEIAIYNGDQFSKSFDAANTRLNSDVEIGVRWVEKLREWSVDAKDYYALWPSMSNNSKDATTREMLRRMGLTWDGLADLLVVLDKGS